MKEITDLHIEYKDNVLRWKKIDDICDSRNLKNYLVKINPDDKSTKNVTRNNQYFERAVFYGITGYTSRGMVGLPFSKWPKLSVPSLMEYVNKNVDGKGNSIYQQSQMVMKNVVRNGRCGLFVDYPNMGNETASIADLMTAKVYPTIQMYTAAQIINWEISASGSVVKLSRVVISISETVNGELENIILELFLNGETFWQRKWYQPAAGKWEVKPGTEIQPRDGKGNPMLFIPFAFVGSENNTPSVDEAPMYNMASIEVGHFNNSAEDEDITYQCGQPQPWMSGLTQDIIDMFKKNNIYVGGRQLMPVPTGEQFGYAQIQENTKAKSAMADKEQRMVSLGAMMITPGSAAKTASQYEGEAQTSHSVLSLIVSNVSEAYTQCLIWGAMFLNIPETNIEYTIKQEFVPKTADANTINALLAALMKGALTREAWIKWTQAHNLEDPERTVEEISQDLDAQNPMPNLDANQNNDQAV